MNNLYLIVGESKENNQFYLDDILNKIKASNEEIIRYDLMDSNFSDILDEASMISLFSKNKVIVGLNLDISKISDDEYEYFTKYLDHINTDVYIILMAVKIDARSKIYRLIKEHFNIIETSKMSNTDHLVSYVSSKVKEKKYNFDRDDILYFLDRTGEDINNINLELDKLLAYKSDDRVINRNDIELLVTEPIDNIIYEFTNAFLENNIELLIKMYQNFKLMNVGFDYLVVSLSNALRQAIIIKIYNKDGKSNSEIAKLIGKKEFYVKKMLERIYQYSVTDLGNYIVKLAEIDSKYKSGLSNFDELELFLVDKER